MKLRILGLSFFAVFSTGAFAQEVAIGASNSAPAAVVWDKVSFGMPRAEIERLYPEGAKVDYQKEAIEISDIVILDGCEAEVNIRFTNNAVHEVMIAGNPSMGGRCSEKILAGLSGKYGQPLDTDKHKGSILGRQGRVFIWNRPDGVTMRLKKYSNGAFGGGGIGKASWELTYNQLANEIAL